MGGRVIFNPIYIANFGKFTQVFLDMKLKKRKVISGNVFVNKDTMNCQEE